MGRSTRRTMLLVSALALGFTATASAENELTTPGGRLRKLGRGVANIVTAPAELVRTSELVGRRDGYVSAMSVGLFEGTWRTLARAVTGEFEVATFYLEIPDGFGPLMKPEFVWEHGGWAED